MTEDRLLGALYAHAMGDAFGAPVEFISRPITHQLTHQVFIPRRFQTPIYLPVGSVTDDTQMTQALLNTLITTNGYDRRSVILAYHHWVQNAPSAGRNTRELLKFKAKPANIIECFMRRWRAQTERSQSNGSLMRCIPLVLLPEKAWTDDCKITNPTAINYAANQIYLTALKALILGKPPLEVARKMRAMLSQVPEIYDYRDSDPSDCRGWVGWVLILAYKTLVRFAKGETNYLALITSQLKAYPKGDTDTNAAISGGLIGAALGYQAWIQQPHVLANLNIIKSASPINYEAQVPAYVAKYLT